MCIIPVVYGCGHTRRTQAEPCLASLQGKPCSNDPRAQWPPIKLSQACLVCTAQVQAQAAQAQAEIARIQAVSTSTKADAAAKKAETATVNAGIAKNRVERAKYLGEAKVRIEIQTDKQDLTELVEKISGQIEQKPTARAANDPQTPFAAQIGSVAKCKEGAKRQKLIARRANDLSHALFGAQLRSVAELNTEAMKPYSMG